MRSLGRTRVERLAALGILRRSASRLFTLRSLGRNADSKPGAPAAFIRLFPPAGSIAAPAAMPAWRLRPRSFAPCSSQTRACGSSLTQLSAIRARGGAGSSSSSANCFRLGGSVFFCFTSAAHAETVLDVQHEIRRMEQKAKVAASAPSQNDGFAPTALRSHGANSVS